MNDFFMVLYAKLWEMNDYLGFYMLNNKIYTLRLLRYKDSS